MEKTSERNWNLEKGPGKGGGGGGFTLKNRVGILVLPTIKRIIKILGGSWPHVQFISAYGNDCM